MDCTGGTALSSVLEQALHRHLTYAAQGLLPSFINAYKLKHVLDLYCRTGSWTLDLALAYPGIHVTGIDPEANFIYIARASAAIGNVNRVRFYHASPTKPLQFSDQSFDLIHLSLPSPLLRPCEWPELLQECRRVLKPGGMLNTIGLSPGPTSSEAHQRLLSLSKQALMADGFAFSPPQSATAIPAVYLCHLLNDAGFMNTTYRLHAADFGGWNNSTGRACCQWLLHDVNKYRPLLLQHELVSETELDLLLEKQQQDMAAPDFCATAALISVSAQNPL